MKEDKRLEVLDALWGGEPYCVRRDEEGRVVLPVVGINPQIFTDLHR